MKIYCRQCKYFDSWVGDYSAGKDCHAKKVIRIKGDYESPDYWGWAYPHIKNKKNNCKDFKHKQYGFWERVFKK